MNKEDPLAVAAECTAAYHATNPLIEAEVDLIWVMMGARNVQSVANSAHSFKLEPDNECLLRSIPLQKKEPSIHHCTGSNICGDTRRVRYLLVSAAPAWGLLRQADAIELSFANQTLRAACGYAPAPAEGTTPAMYASQYKWSFVACP